MVISVESNDHFNQLIGESFTKKNLLVVDFYTTWCGPCKMLAPILEALSDKYKDGSVVIAKVDVQELSELGDDQDIASIPTIKYFLAGKEVYVSTGMKTIDELIKDINKYKTI